MEVLFDRVSQLQRKQCNVRSSSLRVTLHTPRAKERVIRLSKVVLICLHHEFLVVGNGSKERLVQQVPGNVFHHRCVACENGLGIHHLPFLWNCTDVPQTNSLQRRGEMEANDIWQQNSQSATFGIPEMHRFCRLMARIVALLPGDRILQPTKM